MMWLRKQLLSTKTHIWALLRFGLEKLTTYWGKIVIESESSYYFIATILPSKLLLAWFQDHWRHYTTWLRIAESSMKAVFENYAEVENDDTEDDRAPTTQRNIPTRSVHERRFSQKCLLISLCSHETRATRE